MYFRKVVNEEAAKKGHNATTKPHEITIKPIDSTSKS